MGPNKKQRKSRDLLARTHIECRSVEQWIADPEGFSVLVLRFDTGSTPHVYLIRWSGEIQKMGVWP